MRLPSLSDRLSECFVRPLSLNRMLALVPAAVEDSRRGRLPSKAFEDLEREVDEYMTNTAGSGIDLPPWLHNLSERVEDVVEQDEAAQLGEAPTAQLPGLPLTLREVRRQLKNWAEPLASGSSDAE